MTRWGSRILTAARTTADNEKTLDPDARVFYAASIISAAAPAPPTHLRKSGPDTAAGARGMLD